MNTNFCEMGPTLASKIPKSNIDYKSFLTSPVQDTFFLKPVSKEDVLKEILKLNHNKSAGPDGFTPKIVQTCAYVLFEPLTYIFNKSIQMGIYPDFFKLAKVLPIYKSKTKSDPSNYRPISLLNCFNKIFEKLINKQLVTFIKKNEILYKYQYAFREGYSQALALLEMTDNIKKEIDLGKYVATLFIDLKKAFDTVNHTILLEKLHYYGFRGHCNDFIRSYLSNRKQFVHCNGTNSEIMNIDCGVPQGSVLGPTLFLLYVNDMYKCIEHEDLKLFADDTICSSSDKNLNNVFEKMRVNIGKMKQWFDANKLTLNLTKTSYSIFHSIAKTISEEFDTMEFCGTEIKRNNSTVYLGLTIDEVLSWTHHVDNLITSLKKYFSLFYQLRNAIPSKMKMQIFHAYVYSKISYGLHCYWFMNKVTKKKTQVICNKLLKTLMKKDMDYSTNKLYKEYKLLQLDDMHKFLILQFVHKSMYVTENTPEHFKAYYTQNVTTHNVNVRDNLLVKIPRTKTEMGTKCIYWYGATLWNKLPYKIRSQNELLEFKRDLKEYMLSKY